jgi:hypothetical protein
VVVDLVPGSRATPAAMQIPDCRRLVGVALGAGELYVAAGGLVQRLADRGTRIDLLTVTDDAAGDLDDGADDRLPAPPIAIPGVEWHRLALRRPLGDPEVTDLVGALSELIGFDPGPKVYCLAPDGGDVDPDREAVSRAAELTASAYRLPVLRYLAGEQYRPDIRVLDLGELEWARKRAAVAAGPARPPDRDLRRFELFAG